MDRQKKLFPQRLWELVNDPRYDNCLRWSHDGQKVYLNRNEFEQQYLSSQQNQFHTQKAISFVRQMNMYGFRKVDESYYENDHFKRDYPHLLKNMVRRNSNRNSMIMNLNATSASSINSINSTTSNNTNANTNIISNNNDIASNQMYASPRSDHSQASSDNEQMQHQYQLPDSYLQQQQQHIQQQLAQQNYQPFNNITPSTAQFLLGGSTTITPIKTPSINPFLPATPSGVATTTTTTAHSLPLRTSSANTNEPNLSATTNSSTRTTLSNPATPPTNHSLGSPPSPSTSGAATCSHMATSTKNLLACMKLRDDASNSQQQQIHQLLALSPQLPLALMTNQQQHQNDPLFASKNQQSNQHQHQQQQQLQHHQLVQALAAASCAPINSSRTANLSVSPTTLWGSLCQSISSNHLNLIPTQLLTQQNQQQSQDAAAALVQHHQLQQQQHNYQQHSQMQQQHQHHQKPKQSSQEGQVSPDTDFIAPSQTLMNNNFLNNLDQHHMMALSHGVSLVNARNQTNADYASANETIARAAAATNTSLQMALMQNQSVPGQLALIEAVRNQAMLENALRSINFQQQQHHHQQQQNNTQNQQSNQLFPNPNLNQLLANSSDSSSLLLTASLGAALAALSQATTTSS